MKIFPAGYVVAFRRSLINDPITIQENRSAQRATPLRPMLAPITNLAKLPDKDSGRASGLERNPRACQYQ
jgi:hypothetical protein